MHLKNLLSLLQKRFLATSATLSTTSATSQPNPSSSSFTVHFLVNSCGLPLEVALSASKTIQLDRNNAQKPQSLLSFLKSYKFNDTQIAKLISKRPSTLQSRIHNNLEPKFQFLIENGFGGELLPKLILSNTEILSRSLGSHIKPTYKLLKKFLKTEESVVVSVKRASWLLTMDAEAKLVPIMELFVREGVPDERVTHLLLSQPRTFVQNVDRMAVCIKTVKEFGFQPGYSMFTEAVRVKSSMSDSTWNKKVQVFKDLGWSEQDIAYAFVRSPRFLACSEEKIRTTMDFYVNTMKLELKKIVSFPKLFNYSIETRVRPRYRVLKVLVSKGLIKHDIKPVWVFQQTETRFLDNFVLKYVGDVPNLLEIYNAAETKAI
ncbi:transcription termination factor MTERF4, chloroplastic [Ziziphus jujuba]|uniref:Transcription termination factor MTERF4, chloroplastic n=1 Tax=Ziziphus jujuba TaxID=326968 RepID=A0A6P3ZEN6_ZIZJJ|nr:transcription termination factor MTERF4, chloroplastic [Ziziphus jujuba]